MVGCFPADWFGCSPVDPPIHPTGESLGCARWAGAGRLRDAQPEADEGCDAPPQDRQPAGMPAATRTYQAGEHGSLSGSPCGDVEGYSINWRPIRREKKMLDKLAKVPVEFRILSEGSNRGAHGDDASNRPRTPRDDRNPSDNREPKHTCSLPGSRQRPKRRAHPARQGLDGAQPASSRPAPSRLHP